MKSKKTLRCKMCNEPFLNPMRKGSGIAIITCDGCRRKMFRPETLRKMEKEKKPDPSEQERLIEQFNRLKVPINTLRGY